MAARRRGFSPAPADFPETARILPCKEEAAAVFGDPKPLLLLSLSLLLEFLRTFLAKSEVGTECCLVKTRREYVVVWALLILRDVEGSKRNDEIESSESPLTVR